MNIIVIGSSGYVGAKVYSDLKNVYNVTGTYYSNRLFEELQQLDIRNDKEVLNFIKDNRPDLIIHAAANANVDWCDRNQNMAILTNRKGTENIVKAANRMNAKIIYISSFGAINPSTLYGKTKFAGEEYIKNTKSGYIILRPSLIFGYSQNIENDRPFNRLLKNLFDKVPAIYDNSWKFQPTYLRHVSELIQVIIQKNIMNEIIPVAVPELKTKFDVAKDILELFGVKVKSENKESNSSFYQDLDKLDRFRLPKYSYSKMIKEIIIEIKEKLKP